MHCTRISEAITLIRGEGCSDFKDWKFMAFKRAEKKISASSGVNKQLIFIIKKAVNKLPENSICFENIHHDECTRELNLVAQN